MTKFTVFRKGDIELRLGDYREVLRDVEPDAVIVDAPYSSRTHGGHGTMVSHLGAADNVRRKAGRRSIDYEAWNPVMVEEFVRLWSPRTGGWMVSLTDHVLGWEWAEHLDEFGRYVFPPLPCVSPGSRCRLSGDGPSSWTTWAVVARPRSRRFMSWGTLPGAYRVAPQRAELIGSKPVALMRALVRDYSRPGDLVCDPCAGGATTLIAAAMEGRRAIGSEIDPDTFEKACKRIDRMAISRPLPGLDIEEPHHEQMRLDGDA